MSCLAEKIRRQEIEKFDFASEIKNLRRIQRNQHCTPQIRKIVISLIDIASDTKKYSTEALEDSKLRILILKNKFNIKEKHDDQLKIKKFQKSSTKKKVDLEETGPQEISNCPNVRSKLIQFKISSVKEKPAPKIVNHNLGFSSAQNDNYEKDNRVNRISTDIRSIDSMNSELKKEIIKDLQRDLFEPSEQLQQSATTTTTTNSKGNQINLQNIDKIKTLKIVKKSNPNITENGQKTFHDFPSKKTLESNNNLPYDKRYHSNENIKAISAERIVRDPRLRKLQCVKTTNEESIFTKKDQKDEPLKDDEQKSRSINTRIEGQECLTIEDLKEHLYEEQVPGDELLEEQITDELQIVSDQSKVQNNTNYSKTVSCDDTQNFEEKKINYPTDKNNEGQDIDVSTGQILRSISRREIRDSDYDSDQNSENGIEITLELAAKQQSRHEKKRKATKRTGVQRRSKRLKQIKPEIIEADENTVTPPIPEQNISTEPTEINESNEICDPVVDIGSNIPILNEPVLEAQSGSQEYCYEKKLDEMEFLIKSEPIQADFGLTLDINVEQESSVELDLKPKIKEELVDLPDNEIETARVTIENLSFVNHQMSFQFSCLKCHFISIERSLFLEHLSFHIDLEWSGFCFACDTHVKGNDGNLYEEFDHMLKVHVKNNDIIVLDNEPKACPILKIRDLDGDHLSRKYMLK
ncbi:uncharacterized protein LOC134836954 isoform X2 [Culicoides brevitarsis]|uniref:uncharacterized protein LOC134836954 isoform X2 n=1 Tax=Culicoides brevitarsis TaxID=469753 RepID=UPI00307C5597